MYFLKGNLDKKGNIRIHPVSGQVFPGGGKIDETFNVSCPRSLRKLDLDTVYYCTRLTIARGGKYYIATGFDIITPGSDLMKIYEEFVKKVEEEKKKSLSEDEKTTATATEEETIEIPTLYKTIMGSHETKAPVSDVDGFFMQPEDWGLLVRNVQKHINTMILGPAGSGKTSSIRVLCERLGLDLHIFDMGSMTDPISSLLGVHRLEGGASIFDYAKFTQVIQKPCVILLDELSRAPQSAMNILFPCLDDRRSLSIEMACGKGVREIKIHPEVTFIATANVGAEYSGTNSMDRALVNRFFTLELGYIPQAEEEKVLSKRTGVKASDSKLIVKIANNIRSLAQKQEVSTSPSIRETLMVSELVADGWALGKAMQMVYLPLYEGTKSEGERGTIFKTISSY